MYQPWHHRHSLPPCCPYLRTSNILPNNKVYTWHNGQCSEKELSSTSGRQILQIDRAVHTTTSSCEWRWQTIGGRNSPSVGSIVQLTIKQDAFGGEQTWNGLFKQWRERNGSRIMRRERPLWQGREFKTQSQRLCKSWKISLLLKAPGRQPESPTERLKRCWMLSETVWVISQVPTMSTMGKRRKMMRKIQSSASRLMMMNPAGWRAQSAKQYSNAWRVFGRSRWGLTNWHIRDGGTQQTTSVREIWSIGLPTWSYLCLSSPE